MKVEKRRKEILHFLAASKEPVSGGELAEQFGVSRQIIVQDISMLKAAGCEILSTHSGYLLQKSPFVEKVFKVKHSTMETQEELNLIVDAGGTVVDVFVWHKVYGKMEAALNISSRMQTEQFIQGVRTGKSTELMHITSGYHYHTVRAESREILQEIEKKLAEGNFLVPELEESP